MSLNDAQYLVYKYLFADLRTAIDTHASGSVLDIGCGNKPYKPWFAGKISAYTGCDVIQSSENQVDIICQATAIPLPDSSFETVFSTQVIEHVADHNQMLAEAFRLLRPGGTLIVSGPMYWEHHEVPYDFFRFTRYGFIHILEKAGFSGIELYANGGKWALTGQMLQNNIRSSFGKGPGRKLLKGIYWLFRLKWVLNMLFRWLDKVDYDESTTLNWVAVARKA